MEVIATLWKVPYHHDRNRRMIEAGVDCFRIKCSHWEVKGISGALQAARKQIDESGKPIKLIADLPEAKLRLGFFPQERLILPKGKGYLFKFAESSDNPESFIPVKFKGITKHLKVGDEFYIGDGWLAFTVTEIINEDSFKAITSNTGQLVFRTSLTIPKLMDELNHITPVIDELIVELPKCRPEIVAFSFVNSKAMLQELKNKLLKVATKSWQPKVIAKIESKEGVKNIDEILELADGIMVARGDLALNIPYAELGLIQKKLVKKAKEKDKYVIVATQILQSLLDNYLPMRSDILDLTNICLDGASAIMLCTETAHSENPERAVRVAKEIIKAVN